MRIEQVTQATPELVATIERLLPQLSEARTPPTLEELQQTLDGETMLLAYGDDGQILGTLTLVSYRVSSASGEPTPGVASVEPTAHLRRRDRRRSLSTRPSVWHTVQ